MHILRLRFSIFCLSILSIVCVPVIKPVFNINGVENFTYYYYTYKTSENEQFSSVIDNGDYSIIVCNSQNYKEIKKKLPIILGECIRIDDYDKNTLKRILNKYEKMLVKKEKIDNYEVLLCYDDKLSQSVFVGEQIVNLQIAISTNQINLGYPLILNGF